MPPRYSHTRIRFKVEQAHVLEVDRTLGNEHALVPVIISRGGEVFRREPQCNRRRILTCGATVLGDNFRSSQDWAARVWDSQHVTNESQARFLGASLGNVHRIHPCVVVTPTNPDLL